MPTFLLFHRLTEKTMLVLLLLLLLLLLLSIYCLAAYRLVIKFCVFNIILISWSDA
jgi:hypothetical protein